MQHLAAVVPGDERVLYFDEPNPAEIDPYVGDHLVVYTIASMTTAPIDAKGCVAAFSLAPWTRDELLEYLLSVHRDRCASVMSRLPRQDQLPFDGSPEIWRIILDGLASDATVPDAETALTRHVQNLVASQAAERSWKHGCEGQGLDLAT